MDITTTIPNKKTSGVRFSINPTTHLLALLRNNHAINIEREKTLIKTIIFIYCDVLMRGTKILLASQVIKPTTTKLPTNNNICSILAPPPIRRQNQMKALSNSHINMAVNSANILHKIDIRATLGTKSEKDEWNLNPPQRKKTSLRR
jgi:hypothetical protein